METIITMETESSEETNIVKYESDETDPDTIQPELDGTGTIEPSTGKQVEIDKEIDEAVEEINRILGEHFFITAVEVGDYVLQKFFKGDIEEAKSKNPKKRVSFRKLQDHPHLRIPFRLLNQMLNISVQEKELKTKLKSDELNKLTYSHRAELLKLDDIDKKITLAKECIQESLSVRKLRERIQEFSSPGRLIEITKFKSTLKYLTEKYEAETTLSEEAIEKMSPNQIDNTKETIQAFLKKYTEIKKRLNDEMAKLNKALKKKREEKKAKEQGKKNRKK